MILFGVLLLGAYAVLQKSMFAKAVDRYQILFDDAGGLTTGARVLLAGVQVGTVVEVKLSGPAQAVAVCEIERPNRIPEGSQVVLPSSLLSIGDRQIEIVPPKEISGYLAAGATMQGQLRSPLASIIPESDQTVAELNATLKSVRLLLEDKQMKARLENLMASTDRTINKFGGLASRFDRLIAQNQPELAQALAKTERSLANLEAVTLEVRRFAESGELQGNTQLLMRNLNHTVQQGSKLVNDLSQFVNDPELRASMQTITQNTAAMTETGTRIAANAEVMSKNGIGISEEANALLKRANVLAGEVEDLLKTFRETLGRIGSGSKSILETVEARADLIHESGPSHYRADVNITIPAGKEKAVIGLYDAFESNKLNLMLQRPLNERLDFRYGVYASKPGIGVDFRVAPRFSLQSNLFGLNDTQFDVRAGYEFGGGLTGWLGVERIWDRNSPSIGIGFRR